MKRFLTLTASAAAIVMMTGCGGGGGSSTPAPIDPMTQKDGILIMYHYPADVCTSPYTKQKLEQDVRNGTNFLLRVESNTINCGTYGRTNGTFCQEKDAGYLQYDTSCVVGFDIKYATQRIESIASSEPMAAGSPNETQEETLKNIADEMISEAY